MGACFIAPRPLLLRLPDESLRSRQQSGSAAPVTESGENTLYSATDLFLLYKQIVKQTVQLNRGTGFLGLVRLLRQYLSEYTVCVLLAQVPGLYLGGSGTASTSSSSLFTPEMTTKMAAFGLSGLSALGEFFFL